MCDAPNTRHCHLHVSHLQAFGCCCEGPNAVQTILVVAQHKLEEPVISLVVLAVDLHTQLLQVAIAFSITMFAFPTSIILHTAAAGVSCLILSSESVFLPAKAMYFCCILACEHMVYVTYEHLPLLLCHS